MSYGSVEILVGDIVRTTGGGPEMVVVRFDGDGAHCTWSVGGREQTAWFSSACMVESGKRRVPATGLSPLNFSPMRPWASGRE
jgi:uncharacterized protein YodC (DUF2158 family)